MAHPPKFTTLLSVTAHLEVKEKQINMHIFQTFAFCCAHLQSCVKAVSFKKSAKMRKPQCDFSRLITAHKF